MQRHNNKQAIVLICRSHQFHSNFTNGFSAQIPAQQLQTLPLISPTPQSPNGQIPSMQPSVQPVQLIEYNGVPTLVFGAVYDTVYYSPPPSYVPSPTLPANSIAPSFTYQTVAPPTPPLNTASIHGQHFFPTHVELIGQPQIWAWWTPRQLEKCPRYFDYRTLIRKRATLVYRPYRKTPRIFC